jgi:hypothetical protein
MTANWSWLSPVDIAAILVKAGMGDAGSGKRVAGGGVSWGGGSLGLVPLHASKPRMRFLPGRARGCLGCVVSASPPDRRYLAMRKCRLVTAGECGSRQNAARHIDERRRRNRRSQGPRSAAMALPDCSCGRVGSRGLRNDQPRSESRF